MSSSLQQCPWQRPGRWISAGRPEACHLRQTTGSRRGSSHPRGQESAAEFSEPQTSAQHWPPERWLYWLTWESGQEIREGALTVPPGDHQHRHPPSHFLLQSTIARAQLRSLKSQRQEARAAGAARGGVGHSRDFAHERSDVLRCVLGQRRQHLDSYLQ